MGKCTKRHPCQQCNDMDTEYKRLAPNPICGLKSCNLLNADCNTVCVRELAEITEIR